MFDKRSHLLADSLRYPVRGYCGQVDQASGWIEQYTSQKKSLRKKSLRKKLAKDGD